MEVRRSPGQFSGVLQNWLPPQTKGSQFSIPVATTQGSFPVATRISTRYFGSSWRSADLRLSRTITAL
jgi:hypothetical protein